MASPHLSISTFRKILVAGGAFAFGSVFAAASIEVGMRSIGYGALQILAYGRAHYNPDLPEIGYAGRPRVHGIQTREGVVEVELNSYGFNDLEHGHEHPAGTFRLEVLGNSYTMALQVARADNWVSRLGDELTRCPTLADRKVETINLGVDGYTIHQQFLLLKDYGLSLSPDFVLLQTNSFLLPGDLDPSKNLSPRVEMRRPGELYVDYTYRESTEFKRRSSAMAALVQRLSDHSRLLQYILEYRRVSEVPKAKEADVPADHQMLERYSMDRALVFGQLAELLRARQIPLAVTVVPTADALSYSPFQSEPLRDEWQHLAASTGVPVFDVEDEARAQVRATARYLHGFGAAMTAGHLNRTGNAFFAKSLATRLCKFLAVRSATPVRETSNKRALPNDRTLSGK